MKKLLIIIFLLLSINVHAETIKAGDANNGYSFTETKNIIKEVLKDYYLREEKIQYHNSRRLVPGLPPEDATSQDTQFTVCSGYVYNSFYEAFKMEVERITEYHLQAARDYYTLMKGDKTKNNGHFLLYYENTKTDKTADKNAGARYVYRDNAHLNKFVDYLQPGDIIVFSNHTMVIYDVVTRRVTTSDGKTKDVRDALILNSNGPGEIYSRLFSTRGLSYSYNNNKEKNGLVDVDVEGGVQYKWLSSFGSRYVNSVITANDGTKSKKASTFNCIKKKLTYYEKDSSTGKYNTKTAICDGTKTSLEGGSIKVNCDNYEVFEDGKSIGSCPSLMDKNYKALLKCQAEECAIIRPYYQNGSNGVVFNYDIDSEQYAKSKLRTEYPGLVIEKTVDKGDNNSVYRGDVLKYTITITNKSDSVNGGKDAITYPKFYIKETIDSDLVSWTDTEGTSGDTKTWKVSSLKPGKKKTLTYSVMVKYNYSNTALTTANKEIEANGVFYGSNKNIKIATGTVKNKILTSAGEPSKESYKKCYNKKIKKSTNTGKKLIDEIYSCAWNVDLNLEDFEFSNLFARKADEENQLYFKPTDTVASNVKSMILNNYWGGITAFKKNDSYYYATLKWKGENTQDSAMSRKFTINDSDFKDGDVLIYAIDYNNGLKNPYTDETMSTTSKDRHTKEKGTYAYIYLDGKFVGINGSEKAKRNEFTYDYYIDAYGKNGYSKHLYGNYQIMTCENPGYIPPDDEGAYVTKSLEDEKVKDSDDVDLMVDNKACKQVNVNKILTTINYETLLEKDYFVILRPEIYIASLNSSSNGLSSNRGGAGLSKYPTGDVDGNGQVGISDYLLIRKHVLKMATLTDEQSHRADINGDGKINITDYIAVRKFILGS